MHPTHLFVYGTLRHDQPEHRKYCRGVTGWRPARMRGEMWNVPAGYRLVVVPADAVLLEATSDALADEARRNALDGAAVARAGLVVHEANLPWIAGEVLEFCDATEAWPPIDAWEEFVPERPGVYARAVVPVEVIDRDGPCVVAVWAYVATTAPAGSLQLANL